MDTRTGKPQRCDSPPSRRHHMLRRISRRQALNAPDPSHPPPCPRCGATRTKRLIYGMVDYELLLELGPKEPDFELGWMTEPRRAWHCGRCGHQWGKPIGNWWRHATPWAIARKIRNANRRRKPGD